MILLGKCKKAYKLVNSEVKWYICRVLNDYESIDEANKDLAALLTKRKTEKDLLKEYNKKDIM
jgi:hypothetical protein